MPAAEGAPDGTRQACRTVDGRTPCPPSTAARCGDDHPLSPDFDSSGQELHVRPRALKTTKRNER
jgi:hypothetical protein